MNIFIDIDGTLIDYTDKPKYEVVNLVRYLATCKEVKLYAWSGGGADYAKHWVEKLGLEELFSGYQTKFTPLKTKVDLTLDDEEVTLGTLNLRVK